MNTLISIGVVLLVLGVLVIAVVLASARITSRRREQLFGSEDPVIPVNLASVSDGVIVARIGGQVIFTNEVAREWFSLDGGEPDLWLLAQRVSPADAFLELFAAEGQAAFTISSRRIEATSHRVAVGDSAQFIVVMREEAPLPALGKDDRGSPQALQTLSEITRAMNASLELPATLDAVLDGVRRLIVYDSAQICLWDSRSEVLRPVARAGPEDYAAAVEREDQVYRRDEGWPGWIARKRQTLLLADAQAHDDPAPLVRPGDPLINSYLGVPLNVRNRFIGTLELGSRKPELFDRQDQALLELLGEQAAIAIENARQFSSQAERVAELSGLQKIAEAISALQDPRQLFAQLGQRVAELMGVEIAGVLLVDREQERLVAQRPLHGLPDALAARLNISIGKGSPARTLWEDVSYWYSNDLPADHLVAELDLADVVEMGGMETIAMAAMTVGDERIGMLQVSNKLDGSPFTMEDIRLLQIYANQAAIVVESGRLYGQEQSRVAELEGLQQIAQAMSAFTNPEELFGQLTQRIAELMGVEVCGILIYEPEGDRLAARSPFYGMDDELVGQYALAVGRRGLAREVWREHELYLSNSVFSDDSIDALGMRDVAAGAGLNTVMLAPLSARGRRFGMLQVANKSDGSDFDDDDRRLVTIFAGQAAALIDNARLYQDTDATLRRRAAELRSVSRISRELNATLELERILEVIAVEAQRAEGARWGSLLMVAWDERTGDMTPMMRFGAQVGREALILERACARSGEILVIDDFEKAAHYPVPIPGARSALIVPIRFEERVVGMISLYSDRPRGLGASAAEFVQALASQATIAVTNSTRHTEQVERSNLLRRRADQLTQIFELGRAFRSDQSVESNLLSVARAIAESVGFERVIVSMLDTDGGVLRHMAQAGFSAGDFERIVNHEADWESIRPYLMTDRYQLANSFFVPRAESFKLIRALGLPARKTDTLAGQQVPGRWHAGDLLMVQLRSSAGEPIGLLVVERPRSTMLPERDTLELLEIFANQAAMIIENSRLYQSVQERAEALSESLESLEQSYEELDKLSQEMIRKDVELSQANELLNERAQRLLALHRIMESVDTTREPDTVLNAITASVVREMDIDQCLIAVPGEDGSPQMMARAGRLPETSSLAGMLDGQNPLSAVLEDGEAVVYAPGGKRGSPAAALAETLGASTFVALPLNLGDRRGVILLASTHPGAGFSEDDRDLFALLASQIGVEYENARLYQAVQSEAAVAATDRDRLQQLNLVTTALQQTRNLRDRLGIIARGLHSVGWGRVAVALFDARQALAELVTAGYSDEDEAALPDMLLPGEVWERRFDDAAFMSMRLGSCYYLAHDHPWVLDNVPGAGREQDADHDPALWHPDDQIYLPMYAGAEIIGVINLRDPADGLAPTVASLRPLELFIQQASSALENTRLYQETLELQSYNEAVVQSIQQGIVVTDAGGRIETINQFIRSQYGWTDDLPGENLFEVLPQLGELGLGADFETVVREGRPVERTGQPFSLGGEARTLNIYLYPRYDEQRAVTGVVLLMDDVTQRARLEADIALRGQQLAALNEVSRGITSTLSVPDVLRSALDQAQDVITFDRIALWLRSQQDINRLELAGVRGREGGSAGAGAAVDIVAVPPFDQIARDHMPLVLGDRPPTDLDAVFGEQGEQLRSWVGVPMLSGGILVGILVFEKSEAHAYAPADVQVAAAFANQVAVAIENARLFEEAADRAAELHSRSQRLALLNRISSTLGSSLDQNSILQAAIDEMVEALMVDRGGVYLFDEEGGSGLLTLQSPSRPDGSVEEISIRLAGNPLIDRLQRTRAPVAVENVASASILSAMREPFREHGTQSMLVIPLVIGNALIGMLTLEASEPRVFDAEPVELAQTITNQAAISVQNAQLFQETVTRQRELTILFEAGRLMASSLDLDTVVSNAAGYLTTSLDAEGCAIALFERDRNTLLTLVEHNREGGARLPEGGAVRVDLVEHPAIAQVMAKREGAVLETGGEPLSRAEAEWLERRGGSSLLLLPLVSRDETIGLLEMWHTRPGHHFSLRDVRLARALGASVATAMENARLHDETERRLAELGTINNLSRALTQIISVEDLYQMLIDQLARLVSATSLTIARRDPASGQVTFPLAVRRGQRISVDPVEYGGGDPFSLVIESQQPVLISHNVEARLAERGLKHIEPGLQSFLAIPLASGALNGVLAVEDYDGENTFTEATLRVLSPIAAQVAVSLENARLYGELEQRLSETTTLQEVSRVVNSALELDEIFERVVNELASAFGYPLIALFVVEDDGLVMQAQRGYDEDEVERFRRLALTDGLSGRAVRTGQAQFVSSVGGDRDYLLVKDWVRSEIAVPIISDEEVLGVLTVGAGSDNPLDDNDLALLRTFAGQVAAAMTNARLFEQMVALSAELEQRVEDRTRELREERDRIDTLYRIAVELTASLDLDMVLTRALELVGEAVGADTGALFLVDPHSDLLIHRAAMRYDETLPPGGRQIQLGRHEGLAGWVLDNRESIVIDNVQLDPRWSPVPGTESRRSLLGAPLVANNEVLGCLFFNSDTVAAFSSEHLKLVEAAANQVAASINNAELYRLIRDQAERLGVMLRSQQTEAAKSQAILESVADGVMVSDQAGEIILFNAAAERILGLHRSGVLGRPAQDLRGLYGASAERWAARIAEWEADPQNYAGDFLSDQIELDEEVVSVHVSPVLHGVEYLGLVYVFRDITREVIADRIKSEFVARVSHELRTPMTSIKGYADLLLMGAAGEITPDQRRFLETVRSNADRLSLLVNDLLDISTIEQGQAPLDIRPVNLSELIADVVVTYEGRKQEEGRSLPIKIEVPEDLAPIQADYDRMVQIVTNLVSNAYQYTTDDGLITIRVIDTDGGVQIDVADTGIGIPREDQQRIFERFFRGESQPLVFKTPGTGLGLSIVQQLVELHQGRVWFESEPGQGSTFSVWVPAAQESAPRQQPASQGQQQGAPE